MAADAPVIALTPGEPAGIGPDLVARLARQRPDARLVVIADPDLLRGRAAELGLAVEFEEYPDGGGADGAVAVLPLPLARAARAGVPDPANADYVLRTLDRAVDGCLHGEFDAMVTGPVHKGVINDAGVSFSGHTEYLAARTGTPQPVMMLVAAKLRVALVTTHVALAEVPRLITRDRLRAVIEVLERSLRELFAVSRPQIGVCGLNPHAGESGHLGREELEVIAPVLEQLRASGLRLTGPLPADTAFTPASLARLDAVLAMYHDQGLPVLKHAGFGEAVNVTLGLPLVRTSVDHGTAFSLAGTGRIDHSSLAAAVELAAHLARSRMRPPPRPSSRGR